MEDNMTEKRDDKPKWGKHMQIPEVREKLFELSKQLNPPRKKDTKYGKSR